MGQDYSKHFKDFSLLNLYEFCCFVSTGKDTELQWC